MTDVEWPAWAIPPQWELNDLHWLAMNALDEGDRRSQESRVARGVGVLDVLLWVGSDSLASPITQRPGHPDSAAVVQNEMMLASAACFPETWGYVAQQVGVAEWSPPSYPWPWLETVYETLRWLLFRYPRPTPPLEVPARGDRGGLLTADELFGRALQAVPGREWLPEERARLWFQAEVDEARSHQLLAVIKDTAARPRSQ